MLRMVLAVLVGSGLWAGWRAWHSRAHPSASRASALANAATAPAQAVPPEPQPDGTLVFPPTERSGRREPIVLVPVSARSTPLPLPPPAEPEPAPTPSQSGQVGIGSGLKPANLASNAVAPSVELPGSNALVLATNTTPGFSFNERALRIQAGLVRHGCSPGSLDGVMGSQTRAALRAFQQKEHLTPNGVTNEATLAKLDLDAPLYVSYTVTEEDLAGLQPLGTTWLTKSQQSALAYETVLELVAERSRSNPKLVRWLNPAVNWNKIAAGTTLRLVQADYPSVEEKAAFVRIYLSERKLQAFDASSNLLVHFPCSIAARVDKRPLGEELHIAAIAHNPNYTFDPAVFPESEEARELGRKLILQPGPNNPVGTVWFSLDKPGYGIHGTPKPEEVGRTESHGCFRLANWNAEHLLNLVTVGTPISVEP